MSSDTDKLLQALPVFDGTISNWPLFIAKFRTFLESKDLLDHVETERIPATPPTGETPIQKAAREKEQKEWNSNDAKARTYLLSKLRDDTFQSIIDCKTAYQMVNRLEKHYQSVSTSSTIVKLDKIMAMEYMDGQDINAHLGHINGLITQLKSRTWCWDHFHIVTILRSMPKTTEWLSVTESLKSVDPSNITKEIVSLRLIEKAQEIADRNRSKTSTVSGSKNSQAFAVGREVCSNCGKEGHIFEKCWSKGGGAQGKGPKKNNKKKAVKQAQSANVFRTQFAFTSSKAPFDVKKYDLCDLWHRDSAASIHLTPRRDVFKTYRAVNGDTIKGISGTNLKTVGIGEVEFDSYLSDGSCVSVLLRDVHHVPEATVNIVLTIKLDEARLKEATEKGKTVYTTEHGQEAMTATKVGGQFLMNMIVKRSSIAMSAINTHDTLLHRRLGHLSMSNMQQLAKLTDQIKLSKSQNMKECDVCNQGKATKITPTAMGTPRSRYPLD